MASSVAIVIPVWKENLTSFERVSLLQCCSILKRYRFVLVSHEGLNLDRYLTILEHHSIDFDIELFKKSFFDSRSSYNKLMLSVGFYKRFLKFDFILIHQIDCFVFRDELDAWTRSGYSYIGAPWLKSYESAIDGGPIIGVGNGGFSLRHVSHHLRALMSFSYIKSVRQLAGSLRKPDLVSSLGNSIHFLKGLTVKNNTFCLFNDWSSHEDLFWGGIVSRNFSWFSVPPWEVAAQFSLEVQPRYFFGLIHQHLPFGCHAWWTYDLEFWKPHIEKFGYHLTTLGSDAE